MDDYWCLVGDKQILITIIPKLKNPDFWTKLDPKNTDSQLYIEGCQNESEAIGPLMTIGALTESDFKNVAKTKSALLTNSTSISISLLSISGTLNSFINLPELLGDQPLFEQQAMLLFAAYHSVDVYSYIKKYGTSELAKFIPLSEKKS